MTAARLYQLIFSRYSIFLRIFSLTSESRILNLKALIQGTMAALFHHLVLKVPETAPKQGQMIMTIEELYMMAK